MKNNIEIKYSQDGTFIRARSNYIESLECYEVELITNSKGADTKYRIEMLDENYINITVSELKALKALLNDKTISKLLEI